MTTFVQERTDKSFLTSGKTARQSKAPKIVTVQYIALSNYRKALLKYEVDAAVIDQYILELEKDDSVRFLNPYMLARARMFLGEGKELTDVRNVDVNTLRIPGRVTNENYDAKEFEDGLKNDLIRYVRHLISVLPDDGL